MWPQQPKKKPTTQNDSILESIRDLSGGVAKTVSTDVVGKVATNTLLSLFGSNATTWEPNLPTPDPRLETKPPFRREMARPVIRRPEIDLRPLIEADANRIRQEIEVIRMELKNLSASLKNLNTEVQKAVNDIPVNPGQYHLNFLSRLRGVLKILSEQIQDSSSWLAWSTNRKQKKGYWGMYKKHGTKFGLSNERTMATQAG